MCLSILQPIPGTEVFEQLKPYLLKDVAEIEFHYWHSTESFKHPHFTHQELHSERASVKIDGLVEVPYAYHRVQNTFRDYGSIGLCSCVFGRMRHVCSL